MEKIKDQRFDTVSAAHLTGIGNKAIAMWVGRGFVTPADEKELGRRKKYYYFNFYNLVELIVLNLLGRQHYCEYGFIQKILVSLRQQIHGRDLSALPPFLIAAQFNEKTGKTSIAIREIDRDKLFRRSIQPDAEYNAGGIFLDLANIAEGLTQKIKKQS
jgi:hypothetical protein